MITRDKLQRDELQPSRSAAREFRGYIRISNNPRDTAILYVSLRPSFPICLSLAVCAPVNSANSTADMFIFFLLLICFLSFNDTIFLRWLTEWHVSLHVALYFFLLQSARVDQQVTTL